MLREWFSALLDILYPPRCPACRAGVSIHGEWCGDCASRILNRLQINRLNYRLKALDTCQVVCKYEGAVKRLIHDLKFRKSKKNGAYLEWLLDRSELFVRDAVVIPVPLHSERLQARGYNQTELIFKEWASRRGLAWNETALVRVRDTLAQWELDISARRKNIKGAFAVTRPEEIYNKKILLVDDIFTTGATMEECARVLKQAGAFAVSGLVLASGAR